MEIFPRKTSKTVYVLGAGFSLPAGAPNQAGILSNIFSEKNVTTRFASARESLREFLLQDLQIEFERIDDVALEDVYTPIDRCIADNLTFKSKSVSELRIIRDTLAFLISATIELSIRNSDKPTNYIDKFASRLVSLMAERADLAKRAKSAEGAISASAVKSYDPISVISLNWDILLDNAIHNALQKENPSLNDYDPFGVVDYCCYISSVEKGDPRIRSGLWTLGCGGYNVKLLKIHGSMNWLQCPNCQRLFVQFGKKIQILDMVGTEPCRHCNDYGQKNMLTASLIMPTFLKDLSNFQIKLVWQNAGVELMEAKNLVFIGYSLPHADFEFRQLLSRMVHKDVTIEVVLYKNEKDEASVRRYDDEKKRYKSFFGKRPISFHHDGVVNYINRQISD